MPHKPIKLSMTIITLDFYSNFTCNKTAEVLRDEIKQIVYPSLLQGMVRSDHVNVPEQPALSKVTSVGHTPLLDTPDPFTDTSISKFEDDSDLPTHFPTNLNPDVTHSEEQEQEDGEEEADSEDFDSGNSFSGYDSHKFPIDMGQGDIVQGYGPR